MTLLGSTRWCCALTGALSGLLAAAGPAQPQPDPPKPGITQPTLGQTEQPDPAQADETDPELTRPKAAARIVRVFDFEEELTNPMDIPRGWIRAQHDDLVPRIRPGYPIWNRARLDYKVAAHGYGSVRLPVHGGNASLRLEPGVLPIFPLGQYEISALVRTTDLPRARPRLVVRALDAHSEPIAESERSAVLQEEGEGWHQISVVLPGLYEDAAYMQIDLEVVQPRTFQHPRLAEHQVWDADFDGEAWFDDVVIMQLPQVAMRTQSPLNVVARPDQPKLTLEIRDLAAEDMNARVRVFDARRRLVDSSTREIRVGRSEWTWQPDLHELGWYRAVVDVTAGGRLIASTGCDLVWVEATRRATPQYDSGPKFSGLETRAAAISWRPFMIELTRLPPGAPPDLAAAALGLGVDTLTLPMWQESLRGDGVVTRVNALRADLTALRNAWIDGEISLATVPSELAVAMGVRPTEVLRALNGNPASLEPFLLEALDKLGDTSARWVLGTSGSTALDHRQAMVSQLAVARKALAKFVPGVELGIGWRADLGAGPAIASRAHDVFVELPSWFTRPPMEALVAPWQAPNGPTPTFIFEPLPASVFTERDAAADLARRTVELWRAATPGGENAFRVGIRDPWILEAGQEPQANPTPAAAAWRALADRLSGRVFAADWAVAKGVRCMLFVPAAAHPERGGLLVAWNETAPPQNAGIISTLAAEPVRIYDIFGNERLVEATSSEDGARQEHRISLDDEPVFIEGIDTPLVQFLASISLDPPLIQSVAGEHRHAVHMHNPWDVPVTGRLIVTEPGGYVGGAEARDRSWEIAPRSMRFDMTSQEQVSLPIMLSFSRSTEAGVKDFVFDIHIVAEKDYGWVRARCFAELTWNDVAMELTVRPAAAGPRADLIVEATITNTGDQTRSFDAVAYASGMSRVRSSIGSLRPGETIVRRFPFANAYDALDGGRVMVSLSEPDGPGRLTRSIEIPRR